MSSHIQAEVKTWGNSLGIIIPKQVVAAHDLHPKDKIVIQIRRQQKLSDFYGRGTRKIADLAKAKQEMKEEWMMK